MKKGELISKISGIALVFVLLASTVGAMAWAGQSEVMVAGSVDVSAAQAEVIIDSDTNVIALDVSTEHEYEAGLIAETESVSLLSSGIDAGLDGGKPVFLFFHADWCHFCQEQMPIIEELELEYAEEIAVIHVNSDDNPQAMTEFGVTGFPAMFLISSKDPDGEYRYQEFTGFTDKETLSQSFDRVITYGSIFEGSGVASDTRCEETGAATEGDFSQDLCIRALAAGECPDDCICLTDEEAEERGLTLCNNAKTECWYYDPVLGDEVMGHCYALCTERNINLIRVHLEESGEIKFVAVINCPIVLVEMIIGGENVEQCEGNYCEYIGGPYTGQVPDFAVTLHDDLGNLVTFAGLESADVFIPYDDLVIPPDLDPCSECPEPQSGWGQLTGCTCDGNTNIEAYNSWSHIRLKSCIYQNHIYIAPSGCVNIDGGCIPIAGIADPLYDYCINQDDLRVYWVAQNGHCLYGTFACIYGCCDNQCQCSDTDGGKDYYQAGAVRYGCTSQVPSATDYCLPDDKTLVEYWAVQDSDHNLCTIMSEPYRCPGACQNGECVGTCYDGVENQGEQGVDCGGANCPTGCTDCFGYDFGNAEDAGYLKLNSGVVLSKAHEALYEYANCLADPSCRSTLIVYPPAADIRTLSVIELEQSTDYIMEAVAYHVHKHTTYTTQPCFLDICTDDAGDCCVLNAENMILHSGYTGGWPPCPTDYCGDCEDHAILREALMRVLGVSWECAFCADHWGEGEPHEFNLVLYRNRWRIMDYGVLGSYFPSSADWDSHVVKTIWNDHVGEFWCTDDRDAQGRCNKVDPYTYTQNYNDGAVCVPDGHNTYYWDICS